MALPHSKLPADIKPPVPSFAQAHWGLLFDRFFDGYENDWRGVTPPSKVQGIENPGGKLEFLEKFAGKSDKSMRLKDYAKRSQVLAEALTKAVFPEGSDITAPDSAVSFDSCGRWLTGTGISHPVEVGMAFHPTLGVPYLCGASVKGLVRAWFERARIEDGDSRSADLATARLAKLFGFAADDASGEAVGQLVFLDATPLSITLGLDVMTPHYSGWYQWNGSAADMEYGQAMPADWHNPIPVQFLVVESSVIQFALAPTTRCVSLTHDEKKELAADMNTAWSWLASALHWWGAGAKTAVGYGKFLQNESDIS